MKELLMIASRLAESFSGTRDALKRIADSLEGCHYELVALRKLAEKA